MKPHQILVVLIVICSAIVGGSLAVMQHPIAKPQAIYQPTGYQSARSLYS
jgi:hypothetical protein